MASSKGDIQRSKVAKAANSHAGSHVASYSYETKIKWVDKAETYIRRGTSFKKFYFGFPPSKRMEVPFATVKDWVLRKTTRATIEEMRCSSDYTKQLNKVRPLLYEEAENYVVSYLNIRAGRFVIDKCGLTWECLISNVKDYVGRITSQAVMPRNIKILSALPDGWGTF